MVVRNYDVQRKPMHADKLHPNLNSYLPFVFSWDIFWIYKWYL